jgi:hypothetical protein
MAKAIDEAFGFTDRRPEELINDGNIRVICFASLVHTFELGKRSIVTHRISLLIVKLL